MKPKRKETTKLILRNPFCVPSVNPLFSLLKGSILPNSIKLWEAVIREEFGFCFCHVSRFWVILKKFEQTFAASHKPRQFYTGEIQPLCFIDAINYRLCVHISFCAAVSSCSTSQRLHIQSSPFWTHTETEDTQFRHILNVAIRNSDGINIRLVVFRCCFSGDSFQWILNEVWIFKANTPTGSCRFLRTTRGTPLNLLVWDSFRHYCLFLAVF